MAAQRLSSSGALKVTVETITRVRTIELARYNDFPIHPCLNVDFHNID
jgi:hypothetical protein